MGLKTTSTFTGEGTHHGNPFQSRFSRSVITLTAMRDAKFCSIFCPLSPAGPLPTRWKLDSHFISKTVHHKPLPVLCASNSDLHKVPSCSLKDKTKQHLPQTFPPQHSVIQRKWTFFCCQTSLNVWIVPQLSKKQPGNLQSISNTALATTPAPFLLGQPGDPGGMITWKLSEDLKFCLHLPGIKDWHVEFCPNPAEPTLQHPWLVRQEEKEVPFSLETIPWVWTEFCK